MLSKDFSKHFGPIVRKHRKAGFLTQEQLAEKSDLAAKMISLIERVQRNPSVNVADSIARGLNGDWVSADEELDQITPEVRVHPAVLLVRYEVYSKAKQWDGAAEIANTLTKLLPDNPAGWLALAYSTRRKAGRGIPEAKEILTKAKAKFPKEYLISFNLACYECQLGDRAAAMQHLKEAFALAGDKDIRLQALEDEDLEPLWKDIGSI
jgi:transcriptional regulator with XRE-family HTH domain